jgi:hypothetical protein
VAVDRKGTGRERRGHGRRGVQAADRQEAAALDPIRRVSSRARTSPITIIAPGPCSYSLLTSASSLECRELAMTFYAEVATVFVYGAAAREDVKAALKANGQKAFLPPQM